MMPSYIFEGKVAQPLTGCCNRVRVTSDEHGDLVWHSLSTYPPQICNRLLRLLNIFNNADMSLFSQQTPRQLEKLRYDLNLPSYSTLRGRELVQKVACTPS